MSQSGDQEHAPHAHVGDEDETRAESPQHASQRGDHSNRTGRNAHASVTREQTHHAHRKGRHCGQQAAGRGKQDERGRHRSPEHASAIRKPLQERLPQGNARGPDGRQPHQMGQHGKVRAAIGQIAAKVVTCANAHQNDPDQSGPCVQAVSEPRRQHAIPGQFKDHHRRPAKKGGQKRKPPAYRLRGQLVRPGHRNAAGRCFAAGSSLLSAH
jgi:hypothetical protein